MKKWYESKLVWLGVIQSLIGMLAVLGEYLSKGDFSPVAVVTLVSGFLTVILRVWFTNTVIG